MSAHKHLIDLLKVCSVLPALVIMPAFATDADADVNDDAAQPVVHQPATNPFAVDSWSGLEYIAPANTSALGGVLKISGNGYEHADINVGIAENNHIYLSKDTEDTEDTKDVAGQGAVLYANGAINSVNGLFRNNTITNKSTYATKASVNGGVFALYKGTDIGSINGDFENNVVTSKYIGTDETTEYTSGSQISAGGGAIHIEGQYGNGSATEAHIGTITGNFKNNAAIGDGYASGGAIYIKGGADREGQTGADTSIGLIKGDFTGNYVKATTNTTDNKKISSGGAISVKRASGAPNGASVNIEGNFDGNYVETNGTDAFGGAIYNEGAVRVTGNFNNNYVSSESANGWGGAVYNAVGATFVIDQGSEFMYNAAASGGAIWNEGTLTFNNGNTQLNFGHNTAGNIAGAIYNKGDIDKISFASFQDNNAVTGGAINNAKISKDGTFGTIGEISRSVFADNHAKTSGGGAIRNEGIIEKISRVTFMENDAGNGGAIWNGSWGLIGTDDAAGIASIEDSTFLNNDALAASNPEQQGGSITNAGKINLIARTEFTGNRAGIKGGAIANVGSQAGAVPTINLQDVTFTHNSAGEMGGAIYNESGTLITLAGSNVFTGNIAANKANDIYNAGTINITGGETKLGGGVTGTGTLSVAKDATLNIGATTLQQGKFTLNGTLVASFVNTNAYAKLDVDSFSGDGDIVLTFGSVGVYDIGTDISGVDITYSDKLYNVDVTGHKIVVKTKSMDEVMNNSNVSAMVAGTMIGLSNSNDYALNIASLNAQSALERGDTEYLETESKKLGPGAQSVTQSVSSSVQNQVISLAANRMTGGIGRSGGDEDNLDYGVWAQGLINHSRLNGQFTGDTLGIAVGVDTMIDNTYTLGIGYAYNNTDVDSGEMGTTNIDSSSIFVYGQYKPNEWFVNAMLNYTMSDYDQSVTAFGATFDDTTYGVTSFGGQVMGGYEFASGITPEVGLRYLHVAQDNYTNGLNDISVQDTDYLTGIAGMQYAFAIESDSELKFSPNLRAALTYDFLSDAAVATVTIPGAASYVVSGESLSRLGGEFGIGLSATYKGWEISANYDLDLHEHYTSHTGMLKFKYDF